VEIEKTVVVPAPANRVWELLLDPQVMGGCVPGMQSIQVISDLEYVAEIKVKVSFISAKFKLKTTIVEQRAPHYLRTEGTGEDTSVASSLKQTSEIFLTEQADGRTELRILVKVDVLGRLGTFGLSAMKTKADRMWDEFTEKLVARITGTGDAAASGVKVTQVPAKPPVAARAPVATPASHRLFARPWQHRSTLRSRRRGPHHRSSCSTKLPRRPAPGGRAGSAVRTSANRRTSASRSIAATRWSRCCGRSRARAIAASGCATTSCGRSDAFRRRTPHDKRCEQNHPDGLALGRVFGRGVGVRRDRLDRSLRQRPGAHRAHPQPA
jgi:carbon monoxide dehydrogenase subunit G